MHTATATIPNAGGEALAQDFEEVFREHCQFVYRSAYSVTGNRQDAEDVLQNIFVKLLERELPSALMRNPKAYLYRAAVNLALNTIRTRKRQRLTDGVELLEKAAPEVPPIPGDEVRRRLMDAIAQLKPKAVEILILRYEHNYSDVQIAQMLGTSRGTVAVTLNRTRARLKKLIDASSGDQS
jgi:RNA polymerase sigma-70 factor (ECF subfamily)